jgi:hypothetical protein
MQQAKQNHEENARSTSSDRVLVGPWDSKDARKEGCIKEARGIIQAGEKRAGEGLIQDQKEQEAGA